MFEQRRAVVDGELIVGCFPYGTTVVICCTGELDLASVKTAESAIHSALESEYEIVVVDLQGLDFLDSAGIAMLVDLSRRSGADRVRVVPSQAPGVARIIELTGVSSMLQFENPVAWLPAAG